MSLFDEILDLINMHQEGPYWDFKKEWYGKEKDDDQLIDIICMANNLENRDAYIIIGIDEESGFTINDIERDENRRNTQQLTDFLRGKKFAGDYRPIVTVEPIHYPGGTIDVIVIHNSLNTPFYLRERHNGIKPNYIYVRLQDSNTPRDRSADYHHVEYLWKKRFGMLLSPIEKVKMYLRHPEDWIHSPSQKDKKYYKYAPEFTIEHNFMADDGRDGYEYYLFAQTDSTPLWSDIRISYFQIVLEDLGGVSLDGGRYFTAIPETDGIGLNGHLSWDVSYKYMVKGEINYLVHEFYYKDDGDEARFAHNKFIECILIFEDEEEHTLFNEYVKSHWHNKELFADGIYIPYIKQLPEYNIEYFKEQYRNVQILRNMLESFRNRIRIK